MNRLMITLTAVLIAVGCSNDDKPSADSKAQSTKTASAENKSSTATPMEYTEVPAKGRIYVLGTKASADKAKAGSLPTLATTKVGYGPNGETVVFEADAKTDIDKKLIAEYDKRHAKK